jgi:hypothetical protein
MIQRAVEPYRDDTQSAVKIWTCDLLNTEQECYLIAAIDQS